MFIKRLNSNPPLFPPSHAPGREVMKAEGGSMHGQDALAQPDWGTFVVPSLTRAHCGLAHHEFAFVFRVPPRPLLVKTGATARFYSGFSRASDRRFSAVSSPWSAARLRRRLPVPRVVRIAPNRAAAPRDSRFGQNERLGDSAIRRFGSS